MPVTRRKLTYADFERIPADGLRHEIIDGDEYVTPSPSIRHQRASRNLGRILDSHVTSKTLGELFFAPIDVVLGDSDIVEPDLVFISKSRSDRIGEKNIEGAPDLVIEILSPSTASVDRGPKMTLYDRSGVREYWIVDPREETLEVRQFGEVRRMRFFRKEDSVESAVLPNLELDLRQVF